MSSDLGAQTIDQTFASSGHPYIEELKLAQGTIPISDPRDLFGDFWSEEENIDDFLRRCANGGDILTEVRN